MGSMFDFFSLGGLLRLIGFGVAIAAFVAGPLRSIRARVRGEALAVAVAPAAPQRMTFLGKVGAMLAMHSVMGVVLGLVSLPFIVAVVRVICSFVLWICGPADGGPSLWQQVKKELQEVTGAARAEAKAAIAEDGGPLRDAVKGLEEKLEAAKARADAAERKLDDERDRFRRQLGEKLENAHLPIPPAFQMAGMFGSLFGGLGDAFKRVAPALSRPQPGAVGYDKMQDQERIYAAWVKYRKDNPDSSMSYEGSLGFLNAWGTPADFIAWTREEEKIGRVAKLPYDPPPPGDPVIVEWKAFRLSHPDFAIRLREYRKLRRYPIDHPAWREQRHWAEVNRKNREERDALGTNPPSGGVDLSYTILE